MVFSLKHTFQSAKSDGVDTTLIQPSKWNAEHTITLATASVLGRATAGTGAVEELAMTGTGNVVMSASPTLTGTANIASLSATGFVSATGGFASTFNGSTANALDLTDSNSTNGNHFAVFRNSGTTVIGSIVLNGTSNVSYNTSSDYRLKNNVVNMVGAAARVASLRPVVFNWASDGQVGEGFIAHELQAVLPTAVTGAKDALEQDGTPKYQQVDYSKVVPLLTAALKEAFIEINALKARLTAGGL